MIHFKHGLIITIKENYAWSEHLRQLQCLQCRSLDLLNRNFAFKKRDIKGLTLMIYLYMHHSVFTIKMVFAATLTLNRQLTFHIVHIFLLKNNHAISKHATV